MVMTATRQKALAIVATGVLALGSAGALAACGSDGANSPPAAAPVASGASQSTVPTSVQGAESAAEDTIDLALADKRDQAVASANDLVSLANGAAAEDLAKAGVAPSQIRELQRRAAELAKLAPSAEPVAVALAANRSFELIAGFLGSYEDPVPADVITLDYLDFEAKLQALAGDGRSAAAAVTRLASTWDGLRAGVAAAGGTDAAGEFDSHVANMQQLSQSGDLDALSAEAQRGLDLVDMIEAVYTG